MKNLNKKAYVPAAVRAAEIRTEGVLCASEIDTQIKNVSRSPFSFVDA